MSKPKYAYFYLYFCLSLLLLKVPAETKVKEINKTSQQKKVQKKVQKKTKTKKRVRKKAQKRGKKRLGGEKKFIFMGCPGEEENFKKISETLSRAQSAWDRHDSKALTKEYLPDFKSYYGTPISELVKDLDLFWSRYQDFVSLESFPSTIFVCDNRAYANLSEVMKAKIITSKLKSQREIVPETITWINGVTRLENTPKGWKISAEEILSEESWLYYGNLPQELLEKRLVDFDVPVSVKAGENYTVNLKYLLPQNIAVSLLLEKEEISNWIDPNSNQRIEQDLAEGKENIDELKRTVLGSNLQGVKRILKANQEGSAEKVRAKMTFFGLDKNSRFESFLGYLELSKKLDVSAPEKEKKKSSRIQKKTFREEALEL